MADDKGGAGGGTTEETPEERNARLQAAFDAASQSSPPNVPSEAAAPSVPDAPTLPFMESLENTILATQEVLGPFEQEEGPSQIGMPFDYTNHVAPHAPVVPNAPAPGSFGFDGTLSQQQLTEAARLTSMAMFGSVFSQEMAQQVVDSGVNPFPIKVSTDLANELPYNPSSPQLQTAFLDAFGVPGFESAGDMLTAMNYFEYEPGRWWRLDQLQSPIVASGTDTYDYGYGSRGRYTSQPRAYGYGGGGLVTWRIGL